MQKTFKRTLVFFMSWLVLTKGFGYPSDHLAIPIIDLNEYEKKIYSQNGEDGVIEKIFEIIGTVSKDYVEFGVENGQECNTSYLRQHQHWQGLMMDGRYQDPAINLQKEFISAENINQLFQHYKVPLEFDLLSIDIDYNDFYVWKAINDQYRPRVVVIEYNASHLPYEDKVVKYDPTAQWDSSNYFGASILAYCKLAQKKGYSLVYAENRGVNLFFIQDDVLNECKVIFKDINCVDRIYKHSNFGRNGPNGGHPADPLNRAYVTAEEILEDSENH